MIGRSSSLVVIVVWSGLVSLGHLVSWSSGLAGSSGLVVISLGHLVSWSSGLAGSSGLVVISLGHLVSSGLQVPVRLPVPHTYNTYNTHTHITHTHLSQGYRFDASDLYSSLFDAI